MTFLSSIFYKINVRIDIWHNNTLLISCITGFNIRFIPGDFIILENLLESLSQKKKLKSKADLISKICLDRNISLSKPYQISTVYMMFPGSTCDQLIEIFI